MSRELVTFGQRVRYARTQRKIKQEQLAAAAQMRQPDISKIERGDTKETPAIARLARALGVDAQWLELGVGPEPDWAAPLDGGGAHAVSLSSLETVPSTTWEQLEMTTGTELPRTFRICIEDNSMEPRVRPGAWVHFNSRETARPGDGVLVRDRTGKVHFREYRAGPPGSWQAHAENASYAPLESVRDGLQVLAVLMAVEARWG